MHAVMESLEFKTIPRKDSEGEGHIYRNVMCCSLKLFRFLNQLLAIKRVVTKINLSSLSKSLCAN